MYRLFSLDCARTIPTSSRSTWRRLAIRPVWQSRAFLECRSSFTPSSVSTTGTEPSGWNINDDSVQLHSRGLLVVRALGGGSECSHPNRSRCSGSHERGLFARKIGAHCGEAAGGVE